MGKNHRIIVTQNKQVAWGYLALCLFFAILLGIECITSEQFPIAALIVISLFIFIPCVLIILLIVLFKIEINGSQVTVRRCLGLVSRKFNVSDITLVKHKTANVNFGVLTTITIYANNKKMCTAETVMIGFKMFEKFIQENVDADRFEYTQKDFISKNRK